MPEAGSIKVGNAYIKITPDLDQSQLKAQLEIAEREIAAFSGKQQTLARQTSNLQTKLNEYVTARYGEEAAKRVKLEQAAAAKRAEYSKTETAAQIKAFSQITEAEAAAEKARLVAAEKAARRRERIALNTRNLEVSYGSEVAAAYRATVSKMMADNKNLSVVRINEAKQWAAAEAIEARKVTAAQEKANAERAASVKTLSALVIRQAQLEAAESVKAARTAQAAYTSAYNARRAEVISTMNMLKAQKVAQVEGAVAAAQAAKKAAQQQIRANGEAAKSIQDSAKRTEKGWTKATYNMGQKLNTFGSSLSEFGRSINSNLVMPLAAAGAAMSALGVSAADSIVQAQTALKGIGITNGDTAKFLKELKEFGVQTPYTVEDMFKYGAQYTRSNVSHGMNSEKASSRASSLVQAVGDLAAYGGNTDPALVERTLRAVGNIMESDRASLRNVRTIAESGGLDIQTLAQLLGFKDREMSKKELKDREALMKKMGVSWEAGTTSKASGQMMLWMAQAAETGGIPGLAVTDALIDRAGKIGSGKPGSPARQMGAATIKGRLANMYEATKFGLSDMFISQDKESGLYKYTGAGAALMGKASPVYEKKKNGDYKLDKNGNRIVKGYDYEGGLLDTLGGLGSGLKGPSSKVIAGLFETLTTLGGWAESAVKVLKDNPGITDAVVQIGKWAALVGVGALALGALIKTFGLLTKVLSPVVGLAKGLFKAGKGASKIVGQATGLGTKTDAQKEAQRIRRDSKKEAKQLRKEAKQRSDPRERTAGRLNADYVENEGRRRARETERQGQADTSWRDRYQQRRTNANGGDTRSLGRRAVDSVRGSDSRVEELDVNTEKAKRKITELESEIESLREKIKTFRGLDFSQQADDLAGADSSVQEAAKKAAKAMREANTAGENLKGLKLNALEGEFNQVKENTSSLRSQVKKADSSVTKLNSASLGDLDGELSDAKGKAKAADSAIKAAAKQAGNLNDKSLKHVAGQLDHVKDAADDARSKVGASKGSLIGRVGQLNEMSTTSVVKQIKKLKDALDDASGNAKTLNSRLDSISNHAPGKGGSSKSKKKKALGGVLPGYTPGQDVHVFTSPTAGELHLSGGESVMRPEWTAAVGAGEVTRLNEIARTQGVGGVRQAMKFAKGGILGKLGLEPLLEASRNYNVAENARGALATMTMDSSSRALGGDVQSGVVGSGTDASHFVGADFGRKFKGIYDYLTEDVWDVLKKLKVPNGMTQVIGYLGSVMEPIVGEYFWNDVWKGKGNIVERGLDYMDDMWSGATLKKLASNIFGGVGDVFKSLWSGGKALLTDPIGFISDGVDGIWELTRSQYNSVVDMVKSLREVWQSPKDYAEQVIKDTYSTAKDNLPNLEGLFDFSGDGLTSSNTKKPDVEGLLEGQMSTPGVGNSVSRWTPQVKMVLSQLGLPASDLALVLHRIKVESGGNPKAINNWDSNAKAGYPSQGLLQTIPQTFAAYAGPYKSRGITDPLASIYAGLNYATHRYGKNWRKALSGTKGYATGTDGADKGWAWVGEEGPELVNFSGGETVLTHEESIMAAMPVKRGYASGTSSARTTGVAAEAKKGVSQLNSAVTKLYNIVKAAFSSNRIGSGTANSLNKWLDKQNKALQKLVKDRTTIATKLKDANAKLAEVKQQESEMATSIADKATQERSLSGIFNSEGVSVTSAISGLKERLASIKTFQSDIKKLVSRGFSKEIIAEIADAGPTEGAAMAKELLNATDDQIDEFNSTYKAIGTASTSLGQSVAKSYYAAGKESAQALVDGFASKDKALVKQIEKIANTITSTLKKKLKVSAKTPVNSTLAGLLTWLTGMGQAVTGGGTTKSAEKKTTKTTTTYSTDSKGRKVTTVTTTTTDPSKGTTTRVTKRTVGGKTTTSTSVTKGYWTGTRSASRGLALVGERGTELVDFKGGERVYNAKDTANALGPRYEIHIHEAKNEDTTQSVLRALKYAETMAAL
ncbi:hypothetical protein ABZ916_25735 [Streptomyces sp. NPDC046853]|uniref:hypothetical protein n=1 Tax=Streptomyces sp. NPDC046853 TaxID=3154920 RepID=UPI00340F86EC